MFCGIKQAFDAEAGLLASGTKTMHRKTMVGHCRNRFLNQEPACFQHFKVDLETAGMFSSNPLFRDPERLAGYEETWHNVHTSSSVWKVTSCRLERVREPPF